MVATGKPLQGVVQAINTWGETSDEVKIGDDQRFTLNMTDSPPFMLRVIPDGEAEQLFSFAPSEGYVNITPLTHLAMYLAIGPEADLETLFHEWDGSQVSTEEVEMAAATVNANLASLFNKHGLDPKTYDVFHTALELNGAGMDAVLQAVRVHIDPDADTLSRSVRILNASGQPLLTFDAAASPPPAADRKPADELQ